ncbi:MAG TPA: monovalent cation/H(+) antiporter subunit G [Candidatus Baltobacteraceae bacterium]|nr:monovalent cation/H(+) antiporter subunit G [Candidatus Baltobacteraceae bacterium]
MSVVVAILLALAVLVEVLAVTGLIVLRTTMQRLHVVGAATCVAPVLVGVAAAVGTHATPSQGAKGLLIALLLVVFGGVLSHATGQAAYARETEST